MNYGLITEGADSDLLVIHEVEARHGEGDLVLISNNNNTYGGTEMFASAGGDICLRYNGLISRYVSGCRDWRHASIQFRKSDGSSFGASHTLAARVARGYRIVCLDSRRSGGPGITSHSIDPKNDWYTGGGTPYGMLLINASEVNARLEIENEEGTDIEYIYMIDAGEIAYLDNISSSPNRQYFLYDADVESLEAAGQTNFDTSSGQAIRCGLICWIPNRIILRPGTRMPWPHQIGSDWGHP